MKAEQRDRILAAADKLSHDLNNIGLQETIVQVHQAFSRLAAIAEGVKTREQVIELLDSLPDVSWKDEKLFISACKYGKQILRLGVIAFAAQMKKDLPSPPGGRKRLFTTTEEEKEVCEFIADLILKKVELAVAYGRAAQQFGGSARSIRRIWEDRDEIAAELRSPDFDTTLNAVKGFLME